MSLFLYFDIIKIYLRCVESKGFLATMDPLPRLRLSLAKVKPGQSRQWTPPSPPRGRGIG